MFERGRIEVEVEIDQLNLDPHDKNKIEDADKNKKGGVLRSPLIGKSLFKLNRLFVPVHRCSGLSCFQVMREWFIQQQEKRFAEGGQTSRLGIDFRPQCLWAFSSCGVSLLFWTFCILLRFFV